MKRNKKETLLIFTMALCLAACSGNAAPAASQPAASQADSGAASSAAGQEQEQPATEQDLYVLTQEEMLPHGDVSGYKKTYTYDGSGNCIYTELMWGASREGMGTEASKQFTRSTYDADGNRLTYEEGSIVDGEERIEVSETDTYSARGRQTTRMQYGYYLGESEESKTDLKTVIEYDAEGRLLKEATEAVQGETAYIGLAYSTKEYIYENGVLARRDEYAPGTGEPYQSILYAYDEKGNLTREQEISANSQDGQSATERLYEYDEQGRLIQKTNMMRDHDRYVLSESGDGNYEMVWHEGTSELIPTGKTTYTYDENGNCIRETDELVDYGAGSSVWETVYTWSLLSELP